MGKMRLARNKGKRMLKTASREQHRHSGPEGLWCPVCNPKVYTAMRKQTAQNRAALREIQGDE